MRIAHFTNNYRPFVGGVPIAIDKLANGLRVFDHTVLIFAPDYGPESAQTDEPEVVRVPALSNFNNSQFALPIPTHPDVYTAFSDFLPDVVHVHHPFLLGSTGLHWAREQNLPVVFTYHTQYEKYAHYMPFDASMVEELAANVGARFANYCDAIIAPSTDMKTALEQRRVDAPITVIPTGVDLKQFDTADPAWLRAHLHLAPETKILLFVSRLAQEKNISFLLRAFAQLADSSTHSHSSPTSHTSPASSSANTHFVLVGDGDAAEDLRREAAQLNIADRVHFLGTLTGAPLHNAFRGADIFVFSSFTETQGMVLLEAMAAGLPVVAVDAPGVRDILENEQNGLVLPNENESAFAAAIHRLLTDLALYARCRAGALRTASQHSIEATATAVVSIYNQVRRAPISARQSRFLLLREFSKYHFNRFKEGLEELLV